jgi:hypothetical protein
MNNYHIIAMDEDIKQSNQYLIKMLTQDVLELKKEVKDLNDLLKPVVQKIEKDNKVPTDDEISKGWFNW